MTSPRPTPALMPRRAPATAADQKLIAPAPPVAGRSYRSLWEQAVLSSSLPPHARLVAIALATHADPAGQIAQQPRLIGLVHDTSLYVAQVAVALTALRARGLLRKTRPADRYETADLLLTIPNSVMARLKKTGRPATDRTTTHA
ncbi:hypothetical protein ACFT7S_28355 [Streptomyces sp. NPDC057136]|uniref:hypothetical protein n=1 Tax=Streptomyces sp. NPDC057136 TaxID=3346029 RepID=UPI00362F6048